MPTSTDRGPRVIPVRDRLTHSGVMLLLGVLLASPATAQTTFTFGGYVKLDVLASKYRDGDVGPAGPLRDFHFPAAIPVGADNDVFADLDFHAKESRFNLSTVTTLPNGETIRAFVEMDFLLAGQGDERVSRRRRGLSSRRATDHALGQRLVEVNDRLTQDRQR